MNTSLSKRRRAAAIILSIAIIVTAAISVVFGIAGFFDADPLRVFPAQGAKAPVGVLYVSGDMGLRFGMGPATSEALASHGITVVGVNSPSAFATRRTRADLNAIVENAVRQALWRAGTRRIVLIGQSYGADILQTGLATLPQGLRARVAAVVLIVPGETAYFRADPSGIAYHGTPDSLGASTVNAITWAPLTCIYGREESDSLCPAVRVPGARIVAMPGGHPLRRDTARLADEVLAAIHRAVPEFSPQTTG